MYHVRFLKAPSFNYSDGKLEAVNRTKKQKVPKTTVVSSLLKPTKGHAINFQSVITISNDLGEEFFYGSVALKVTIQLGSPSQFDNSSGVPLMFGSTLMSLSQSTVNWELGNRSLQISVSVPILELSKCAKELRLQERHKGLGADIFAAMKVEVINPETVKDELMTDLAHSILQSYESFGSIASQNPQSSYESSSFQFLNVTSLPFKILTGDSYEICMGSKSISAPRYCLRSFPTSDWNTAELKLNYKSDEILIIEELGNGIERHLWNAGIHTMSILPFELTHVHKLPSKPKILELGTGVGVISVALSKIFKDAHVLATDLSDAEEICQQNINLNHSHAKFKSLEWSTTNKSDLVDGGWDLIVITDCTYNPSYYDDLINVIVRESNEFTTVLLAHKIREPNGEVAFFQNFKTKFETIHETWIHNLHESVHIGQYKKKID